jgi:DNA-binding NarL/FixJ family response regulator
MTPDTPPPPRILLADDHTLLLDAFRRLLEPAFTVVATVTDGHALLEAARRLQPDIVVADIAMPHLNGLDACERLLLDLPDTRLVFLTVSEDPDLAAEAIRRGAAGFLLKKGAASELFLALERVLAGQTYVTPLVLAEPAAVFVARARRASPQPPLTLRQREVLQLLAEGRSMKEAAEILRVTPRTIAFHKYGMMDQLGLETGAELVQYAVRAGLVRPRGAPSPS